MRIWKAEQEQSEFLGDVLNAETKSGWTVFQVIPAKSKTDEGDVVVKYDCVVICYRDLPEEKS
jgi:hypothetical protein